MTRIQPYVKGKRLIRLHQLPCTVDGCSNKRHARSLCRTHYSALCRAGTALPAKSRVYSLETLPTYVEVAGSCWLWCHTTNAHGYGMCRLNGMPYRAHRWVYEMLVGPIPDGLTLDHLCRVRNCVNPDHLEPVTLAENRRRSPLICPTHCRVGHELTPANRNPRGGCAICRRAKDLRRRRAVAA